MIQITVYDITGVQVAAWKKLSKYAQRLYLLKRTHTHTYTQNTDGYKREAKTPPFKLKISKIEEPIDVKDKMYTYSYTYMNVFYSIKVDACTSFKVFTQNKYTN